MRGFGFTMIALGVLGMLVALGMDTSVSNGLSSRVENIGLLSRQSGGVIASSLLFMTGCILLGLAAVRDAVDRLGPVIVANAPRTLPTVPQRSAPVAPAPSPNVSQPGAQATPTAADPAFSKTCPECGSISVGPAKTCRRCGHQYSAQPALLKAGSVLVGSRVRHPSFGEGEIEAVDGDTATVRFDGRERSEPMNMAYLMFIKGAARGGKVE